MINPIMIDEINQHTTEAVNGIYIPQPFSLTDLMIEGYEEKRILNTAVNMQDTGAEKILFDISGEGFINYLLLSNFIGSANSQYVKCLIDDKQIFGYRTTALEGNGIFGFTADSWYQSMVNGDPKLIQCLGNMNISNTVNNTYPINVNFGGAHLLLGAQTVETLSKSDVSLLGQPIHFKKNFKLVLNGYTMTGHTGKIYCNYYLKTGGGN